MVESQEVVKRDLLGRMEIDSNKMVKMDEKVDTMNEKLDGKIDTVDDKVDQLNKLVLPLTVAMNQTAENTKEISESLKEFTMGQRDTNSFVNEKLNEHTLEIEGVKNITNDIKEKRAYNAKLVVAIIGLIGVFITGLFGLAPLIFG